jgi:ankyrin repeat protein
MDKEKLYNIVTRGDLQQLELLLQSDLDVNTPLPSGNSMIVIAACMGDARLDLVKSLIKHGADINTPIGGMTLLKWIKQSTYCDNEETIGLLEYLGAKEVNI